MAKFLDREKIYRILQRELPEGVYPDGPPNAFYSTADMDSIADGAATGYANLERIYDNQFPQTADESLSDWEIKVLGYNQSSDLTLEQRRQFVIDKIRLRRGITVQDIKDVITSVLGSGIDFEIVEWGCNEGGWVLDESELDISTVLNGANQVNAVGPGLCAADPADYGMTEEEWEIAREEAYTYDVRIYSYTLTAAERAALENALYYAEPVRSGHYILDGLDPADKIEGDS